MLPVLVMPVGDDEVAASPFLSPARAEISVTGAGAAGLGQGVAHFHRMGRLEVFEVFVDGQRQPNEFEPLFLFFGSLSREVTHYGYMTN
jgi:hypothetical protein